VEATGRHRSQSILHLDEVERRGEEVQASCAPYLRDWANGALERVVEVKCMLRLVLLKCILKQLCEGRTICIELLPAPRDAASHPAGGPWASKILSGTLECVVASRSSRVVNLACSVTISGVARSGAIRKGG